MKCCKAGLALTYLAWHHQTRGQQEGKGGHRSVLFGVGCGTTKCSAEHFHPRASPTYTYFPVCLGHGAISRPLGLPSVIPTPSVCQSLSAAVLHHQLEASCHSRNNLPGLCCPSHLPPAWPSLKEHHSGGAKPLPDSGKRICGPSGELLYSGSRAAMYRCCGRTCLSQPCSRPSRDVACGISATCGATPPRVAETAVPPRGLLKPPALSHSVATAACSSPGPRVSEVQIKRRRSEDGQGRPG